MATKMTREEAIKIVQSATVWTDEERNALEVLIPELAGSEDERIRKRLIEYFEGFRIGNAKVKWEGLTVQDVLAWLEKQKEHKPAEWSEKDELMISHICSLIQHISKTEDCREIAWLKSLRPQPHWKPSEEQMKALNEIVNILAASPFFHQNDYLFNILNGLREELKKLL